MFGVVVRSMGISSSAIWLHAELLGSEGVVQHREDLTSCVVINYMQVWYYLCVCSKGADNSDEHPGGRSTCHILSAGSGKFWVPLGTVPCLVLGRQTGLPRYLPPSTCHTCISRCRLHQDHNQTSQLVILVYTHHQPAQHGRMRDLLSSIRKLLSCRPAHERPQSLEGPRVRDVQLLFHSRG